MSQSKVKMDPRTLDLVGFSLVAVVIGVTVYVVWPWREDEALRAKQQQAQATAELLEKQETELRSLERETVQLRALAGDTRLVLSSADALNSRLHALSLLLGELGHHAEEVEPGAAEIEGGFVVTPLRLVTRSSYGEARALIASLHERFPDLRIIGLAVSSGGSRSQTLTTTLQMHWYATPAQRRVVSAEGGAP
ncbi:hypothetical protein [Mucisphaera sp.]|uniref:hypothetical protein n=1 Tax=Mucisphaera sp. TaxID=2913024 RepID=UPI003D0F89F8